MAGENSNSHTDCPFKESKSLFEYQLKTFGEQIKDFGDKIDDLKSFKAKIIGFAIGGSFIVSTAIALLGLLLKQ